MNKKKRPPVTSWQVVTAYVSTTVNDYVGSTVSYLFENGFIVDTEDRRQNFLLAKPLPGIAFLLECQPFDRANAMSGDFALIRLNEAERTRRVIEKGLTNLFIPNTMAGTTEISAYGDEIRSWDFVCTSAPQSLIDLNEKLKMPGRPENQPTQEHDDGLTEARKEIEGLEQRIDSMMDAAKSLHYAVNGISNYSDITVMELAKQIEKSEHMLSEIRNQLIVALQRLKFRYGNTERSADIEISHGPPDADLAGRLDDFDDNVNHLAVHLRADHWAIFLATKTPETAAKYPRLFQCVAAYLRATKAVMMPSIIRAKRNQSRVSPDTIAKYMPVPDAPQ